MSKLNDDAKKKYTLNIGCGGESKDKMCWYGDVRIDIKKFPNVTHIMDAHQLGFKNDTFARITAYEVLEHLESPIKALKEMDRVLKSHGEIEITVPNVWYWRRVLRGLLGQHFRKYRGTISESDHKQMWDIYTFEQLARQVELTITYIDWLDWYPNVQKHAKVGFLEPLIRSILPKPLRYWHVIFGLKKLE